MGTHPYRDSVLEHHRSPRNLGSLARFSHAADGNNPLCGDSLRFELLCVDGRVVESRFDGECCALARASASMLSERTIGQSADEIARLHLQFERLLRDGEGSIDVLGELLAFVELFRYPARRKCALLPWATVRCALGGVATATTEMEQDRA